MKRDYLILPLLLFIFLSIFNLFRIQSELNNYNNSQLDSMNKELKTIKVNLKKVSDSIFDNLINKPQVIEVFKKAHSSNDEEKHIIRQKLFNLLKFQYLEFKRYGIQQLHFHLPNNDSFLRFHKPHKYGDNLSKIRESVKYVNKFKQPSTGFEEGKIFNGYRYVYPLFDEHNNHIGSVEVSASLLSFKESFQKANDYHIDFILTKETVQAKLFKSELKNYKQYHNLNDFLIQRTLYDINEETCRHNESIKKLFTDQSIVNNLKPIHRHHVSKFIDTKLFTAFFIPLENDFLDKPVGYSIIIKESSYFNYFLKGVILSFMFIIMLTLALAYILYKNSLYVYSLEEKEKLKIETYTDTLTQLKNRKAYNEKIDEYITFYNRYEIPFSMIVLDIDYFKKINDTYGHGAGDQVLQELSKIISSIIRKNDFFFRIGGEEFVLLLPHTKLEPASNLAEKIRKRIQSQLTIIPNYTVTISLGVTDVKSDDNSESVFQRADAYLYESKKHGRNRVTSDNTSEI